MERQRDRAQEKDRAVQPAHQRATRTDRPEQGLPTSQGDYAKKELLNSDLFDAMKHTNVTDASSRTSDGTGASHDCRKCVSDSAHRPVSERSDDHRAVACVGLVGRTDPGAVSQGNLDLLARGPEQNLIHVHLFRLAHGEGDCLRK